MLIATDTLMFFVRIGIFFGAVFLTLGMIGDLSASVTENANMRALAQLSENYAESNLTVGRGIFNADAVRALDGNPIEAVRICDIPSSAEFYALTNTGRERIARFGYSESGGTSRESPIWLKFGNQLVPGIMRLTVWPTTPEDGVRGLRNLGCIVERAWVNKLPQKATEINCPWDVCIIYTEYGTFCFAEGVRGENARCRSMPGVNIQSNGDVLIGKGLHKIATVPIKRGGVAACDTPDAGTGPGDYEIETVMLCETK